MSNLKTAVCAFTRKIGGVIVNLLGGWTTDLATLVILMVVDFVMGLALAIVFHKSNKTESGAFSSQACWKGLFKKITTLFLVVMVHRFDMLLGVDYIRSATIIGFITNESRSILENAGLMEIPIPAVFTKVIDVLKTKSEDDKN